jgi:hypothetical protein
VKIRGYDDEDTGILEDSYKEDDLPSFFGNEWF